MKILALFLLCFSFSLKADTFTVNSQATGAVTSSSAKVLDPNAVRNYLLVMNTGGSTFYVKMAGAHVATEGVVVPAGGNWAPFTVPVDSIYIKGAATSSYGLIEGNK